MNKESLQELRLDIQPFYGTKLETFHSKGENQMVRKEIIEVDKGENKLVPYKQISSVQ